MGWTGFNGGAPFQVGEITSLAIFNTHLCTATSILVWLSLDMLVYKKGSLIGSVQGMITGLVCITPGAGKAHISLTLNSCSQSRLKFSLFKVLCSLVMNMVIFCHGLIVRNIS